MGISEGRTLQTQIEHVLIFTRLPLLRPLGAGGREKEQGVSGLMQ